MSSPSAFMGLGEQEDNPIPEPASALIFSAGVVALLPAMKKKRGR